MELANYDKALATFAKVDFAKSSPLYPVKEYYHAMSYLAKDDVEMAKQILEKLALVKSSSYAEKASKILNELK